MLRQWLVAEPCHVDEPLGAINANCRGIDNANATIGAETVTEINTERRQGRSRSYCRNLLK